MRATLCTAICFLMFGCWLGGWLFEGVLPLFVLLVIVLAGEIFPNMLQ